MPGHHGSSRSTVMTGFGPELLSHRRPSGAREVPLFGPAADGADDEKWDDAPACVPLGHPPPASAPRYRQRSSRASEAHPERSRDKRESHHPTRRPPTVRRSGGNREASTTSRGLVAFIWRPGGPSVIRPQPRRCVQASPPSVGGVVKSSCPRRVRCVCRRPVG